jgi:hypothetical protein
VDLPDPIAIGSLSPNRFMAVDAPDDRLGPIAEPQALSKAPVITHHPFAGCAAGLPKPREFQWVAGADSVR